MSELKLQQSRLDGRYDILECLGRGSYAEIYVAHDHAAAAGAPETVVIKALNMSLQETLDIEMERTLVTNFQNEAVALDRVRHPHIISRLGHGTAIDLGNTTFHYLVLEYLPGGDMLAFTRGNPLPIQQGVFYLEQVCSGLAHAHKCGVIHRDIKPQNLLLTADREIVKIADFGVARLEASEGAITRVGTNIYSAPEHNPLVQTGALDTGALANSTLLTPAADVYSLAKTTYSLLAGESPRRFAQHAIKELPESLRSEYWAAPVLRVLEKATQSRPESRYQTVEEFWDDFAEATLRPTQPLGSDNHESRRKPSEELEVDPAEFTQAPPQPRFAPGLAPGVAPGLAPGLTPGLAHGPARPISPFPDAPSGRHAPVAAERGPRIVVQVDHRQPPAASKSSAKEIIAAFPDKRVNGRAGAVPVPTRSSRKRSLLVATVLILAFSGMLLATHKYVTSQWNPILDIPRVGDMFVVGREGSTTTDVNLRPAASSANTPIGLAENGSRVKILTVETNWYEVQVLQHGRPKTDPYSSDRGWINKKFVKFD